MKTYLMKRGVLTILCLCLCLCMAGIASAGGKAKVVVNDQVVEKGEAIGAAVVLDGDGSYDVYAALTGGVLGEQLLLFKEDGTMVPFNGDLSSLPKLRANVNLNSLSVKDKIITLLPKVSLDDTSSIKGTYTFIVALCTPGKLDFPVIDQVSVEIK